MSPTEILPITVSVEEAGLILYDAQRNDSYVLAQAGTIPTVRTGGGAIRPRKRVPVRVALAQLAGGDQALLEQLADDFARRLKIFRETKTAPRAAGQDVTARAAARLRDARDEIELALRAPGDRLVLTRQIADAILSDLGVVASAIREMAAT